MADAVNYPGTRILLRATAIKDERGTLVTPDVATFRIRREAAAVSTTVTVDASATGVGYAEALWTIPDDALPGKWVWAADLNGSVVDQYKPGNFFVVERPV